MNQLTIIGGLTRDPENGTTKNGKQVCKFSVGVNREDNHDESDYFRVYTFEKLADICKRKLCKGKKVAVTGRVSASAYISQNGEARASLDVYAKTVYFLSPSDKTDEKAVKTPENDNKTECVQVTDEDVPF